MVRKATLPEGVEEADKRVVRSRKKVLAVTLQLLAKEGLSGVSIDEVARRSGVAKTTIYRHWPSRGALLVEACAMLSTRAESPDTGSLKGDLLKLGLELARRLRSEKWPKILPSMIDAGEREAELADVQKKLHAGFMEPWHAAVERARARGEVARERETSAIVAAVVGPLYYRRWFSREALDERFVKGVVEDATGKGR